MESLSVANADWFLKPETQAVFACLNREGFEARAVGGAVRNTLLGRPVSEVDFATTARPGDILRLASKAGLKTAPTGIAHGTVTIIAQGTPFEATTLRRDVATDGRRATVAFGEDWAEDARRRDFTMNALYADADGQVYDPLEGLPDLFARRVRFAGDAGARIREDYLRILRFFRFSAEYAEGAFDREGVAASIRERLGLMRLSRERVRAELLRILVARRAAGAIEVLDESGLLLLILGGVARRRRFERLCAIEAALEARPDPIYRLAALALFTDEDAARLADKLRLFTQETNDLSGLAARRPDVSGGMDEAALEAALYRLGPRLYLGRLLLSWADSQAAESDPAWKRAAALAQSWRRPKFPVKGGDLVARGWAPGAAVGESLRRLEEKWIASRFMLSREALLELCDG
jgi:tRNA nucleotidyltransferase/poly(A) polymerase